jgi:hypothetical protein
VLKKDPKRSKEIEKRAKGRVFDLFRSLLNPFQHFLSVLTKKDSKGVKNGRKAGFWRLLGPFCGFGVKSG